MDLEVVSLVPAFRTPGRGGGPGGSMAPRSDLGHLHAPGLVDGFSLRSRALVAKVSQHPECHRRSLPLPGALNRLTIGDDPFF